MSLSEQVNFLFRKIDSTGFKTIREYSFFLLSLAGFNVLREGFYARTVDRIRMVFVVMLPLFGIVGSLRVLWKCYFDIEEAITSLLSFIMMLQLVPKMIELFVHRDIHREIMETVEKSTEVLQEDREYKEIGLSNIHFARSYIRVTSIAYLAAGASLLVYPFYSLIFKGEYKLAANMELPGTDHKEEIGWLINYIFSSVLASMGCLLILGIYLLTVGGDFDNLHFRLCRLRRHILHVRFLHYRKV